MGQLQLKLNDLGAGETPPDEAEEEAGAEAAPEEATQ
jgi:hypothetical protein